MKSWIAGLVLGLVVVCAAPALAASDVYVRAGGEFKPVTIAVTPFAGDGAKVGSVVANDMARSIFLQPLNPSTFPEKPADPDSAPNLDAWKTINAQFVLTGKVDRDGGKLTARFRLWDVATGEQVA